MKIDFFRFSAEVEESIAIMILATANVECQNLVETLWNQGEPMIAIDLDFEKSFPRGGYIKIWLRFLEVTEIFPSQEESWIVSMPLEVLKHLTADEFILSCIKAEWNCKDWRESSSSNLL